MRKILWLSHEVDLGGANKCLLEQMRILHDAGYHVEVIVLRDAIFAEHVRPFVKGVHEVYFYSWVLDLGRKISPFLFWKRVLRNLVSVVKIWRLILRTKPDYVATNTTTIPVAAIASKLAGKKHVWFLHEFGEEDHGYQMFCGFKKGAKLMNWLSEKMVFNSEAVRRKYAPIVPPHKQFIAHNPVVIPATENYPEVKTSAPNAVLEALILGQIAPSKNQLEALQALRLLREQGIVVRLTMAGGVVNEGYAQQIRDFIEKHGLQEQVRLLGYSNNPFHLLRSADLYLMCSRMEAFGRVSVEALKLGVPVIASNTGGSPEIIDDGENGFLYEAGNAEDLAAKITLFAGRRAQFNHRTIAAAANEKYNEAHTRQQLLEIFS